MLKPASRRKRPTAEAPAPQRDMSREDAAAMAALFATDEPAPSWRRSFEPQALPPKIGMPGSTTFDLFGYWLAGVTHKAGPDDYRTKLYEFAFGEWRLWFAASDTNVGRSFGRARAQARRLLLEGQRPEALEGSQWLSILHSWWLRTGEHFLKKDHDD